MDTLYPDILILLIILFVTYNVTINYFCIVVAVNVPFIVLLTLSLVWGLMQVTTHSQDMK